MSNEGRNEMQAILHAPDYGRVDGRNAAGDNAASIAMVLENGAAVVVDDGQAMPLHRVLDAAIFALAGMAHLRESYRYEKGYDPNRPVLKRVGLQGDAMSVEVATDNADITAQMAALADAVARDGELLGERCRVLGDMLTDLGY
ncbi:MAG: hypothetical protein GX810_08650 [Clostridiales bacterium]|nr:hypothetical protein [Clostridiales bacterium]